jgi:hypothetical protein
MVRRYLLPQSVYVQIYILLKCAQITIELHIIFNLLLQQLVHDTIFTWKAYILRQGFKVSSMWHLYEKQKTR